MATVLPVTSWKYSSSAMVPNSIYKGMLRHMLLGGWGYVVAGVSLWKDAWPSSGILVSVLKSARLVEETSQKLCSLWKRTYLYQVIQIQKYENPGIWRNRYQFCFFNFFYQNLPLNWVAPNEHFDQVAW